MTGKTYVIGAGLAGLSAATILAERGATVVLIEAAGQAGGRCRSYFDSAMGGVIDNGNHLVLSGNRAVNDYRKRIGAEGSLVGPPRAEFAFMDLKDGARWILRERLGRLHGPHDDRTCGHADQIARQSDDRQPPELIAATHERTSDHL